MLLSILLTLPAQATTIVIDATHSRPISPYIYGANDPDWDKSHTPFTLARLGGNRMTAYNWETNASNAGNDYRFQSDGYMGESNEPGWTLRTFLEKAQSHGAAAMVTIPTAGYVSADKKGDGDVRKTPNYLETRFYKSLPKKPGKLIYPPDTTDRVVYQDECAAWLDKIKSPKTPLWFMLDNEPDLWSSTHNEIWTRKPTYADIIENNITFATALKAVAPKDLIFGPANYGWQGFRTFQGASDAGGRDFLDVYLAAMHDAEKKAGKRLLDVLDVHWYPEARGNGKRITEDSGNEDARIQAPRSLWDPTYVEDSWIVQTLGGKPIALLPRILKQIDANYPGTRLSISEYDYGGKNDISGTIAQADVLGIFGRYGLFAACNWGISAEKPAQLAGFNAFVNFDGKGSKFGGKELNVTGESAASDSVYAALDGTRLTIVAINKTHSAIPLHFDVKGFRGQSAKAYVRAGDAFSHPVKQDCSVAGGGVDFEAPALSVTTIEVTN